MEEKDLVVGGMPAQSFSASPAETNVSGGKKIRPINISTHGLFLLSAVTALFLLITFFILIFPENQKTVGQDVFKSKDLVFSIPGNKQRFDQFVTFAFSAKDKKEASDFFVKAYFYLKSEYERTPLEDKRNSLILLKDYWTKNYPQEAAKLELVVPCRQESCGVVLTYGQDLVELKKAIDENKDLGEEFKNSIYIALENAARGEGANDSNLKYAGLSGILANLKSALGENKNAGIEYLIKKTEALLEMVDPERFKTSANSAK